jgi:hypothetical protein
MVEKDNGCCSQGIGRLTLSGEELELALEWIAKFKKRHKRPLRVLHIGNIANNAYNNAKIQRAYGIEADVLCHDYYHVMGTPEWEDSDFGAEVDPFFPDWWATKLRGFQRPSWFVQGPAPLCISYMVARAKGQKTLARLRRWGLEAAYWELLEDRARLTGRPRGIAEPWKHRVPRYFGVASNRWKHGVWPYLMRLDPLRRLRPGAAAARRACRIHFDHMAIEWKRRSRQYLASFDPWKTANQRFYSLRGALRSRVVIPLLVGATSKQPYRGGGALLALWRWQQRRRGLGETFDRAAFLENKSEKAISSLSSRPNITSALFVIAGRTLFEMILFLVFLPVRLLWRSGEVKDASESTAVADALVARFQKQERNVPESVWTDFHRHLTKALTFGPVLARYDIVQGYSIDGIIPLSNGFSKFTAYEHGTLREIPFESTWLGLVCRLVYRSAPAIFITNSDVLGAAGQLELDKDKTCYLPHAFDDRKLDDFRKRNAAIEPERDLVQFFCPSRQHWRDQNPSLMKGSDTMLTAAGNLAAEGHRFRLVLVEWGVDVEASKELIKQFKLGEFVSWIPPMNKKFLWEQYCRSHAVLDQFSLPALGGVGFEVLALGRRLITKIDSEQLHMFFGCAPPVLPATNVRELTDSMRSVVLDPQDAAGIGTAGRQWITDFHSARRIVALQANAYRSLLEQEA